MVLIISIVLNCKLGESQHQNVQKNAKPLLNTAKDSR